MQDVFKKFREGGLKGVLVAASRRIWPERIPSFRAHRALFNRKCGLELGGPSSVFRSEGGLFPLYALADRVDNCNFSHQTIWRDRIDEGKNFDFHPGIRPGIQHIVEATDLNRFSSNSYDFVAASHVLEHVANPLKALNEWIRVLREGGTLVLILPHKDATFDHRRPVTTLAHIVQDFEAEVDETDLTHLEEIIRLHDLTRDRDAGDLQAFIARSLRNQENRCLHHHVFDTRSVEDLVRYVGMEILAIEPSLPNHIFILAQKRTVQLGEASRGKRASILRSKSPFPSDRLG